MNATTAASGAFWNIVRPRFRLPDAAQLIWHYTTVPSLFGMLSENYLQATSSYNANDPAELEHGFALFERTFRDEIGQLTADAVQLFERVIANLKAQVRFATFTFSFCERDDLLSQWRAYASSESGVAIGFRMPDLAIWCRDSSWHQVPVLLSRVIYDSEEMQLVFRSMFTSYGASFTDYRATLTNDADRGRAADEFVESATNSLFILLPLCKDPQFREEQEWRLVSHRAYPGSDVVKFKARGPYIVPYIELFRAMDPTATTNSEQREPLPIQEVVLGPRYPIGDEGLAVRSLGHFAAVKGRHPVHIRRSNIRLRTVSN